VATGSNLGPEVLDVVVLDECPDERRRAAGSDAGESSQLLGREAFFRQEPAESVVVEFAD
jgi:hypothetical protein